MSAHDGPRDVARLHAMIADACFGKDAPASFEGDLPRFLAKHGVAPEDAEAIVAAPRRLGLYRRLVRHNVVNIVETMLERTRARLERHAKGVFDETIALFLESVGPRTPHLRDVPAELLVWAAPRWNADARVPRWMVDYAELELVDFTIGVAPRPGAPPPVTDIAADRALVFAEPKKLVRLGWAVHSLAAEDVDAVPESRESTLLVYRDSEHRTRFLELTPLAAAIASHLFRGDALGPAMVAACTALPRPLDQAVLDGVSELLADLGERGVLLGARP